MRIDQPMSLDKRRASIYVNGKDKTAELSDWEIWWGDKRDELMLTCHLPGGKSFFPLSECEIVPTVVSPAKFFAKRGSTVFSAIERAVIYGGKYAVVQYPGNPKHYVMHADGAAFVPEASFKAEAPFQYFLSVARKRVRDAKGDNHIAANVLRQLERVVPHEDTALGAYCMRQNRPRDQAGGFIYPFGVNESQLKAVEQAFASQISLIEGPPGTGKTQTILNIVANIVVRGKSVAIVSNNNAAVENVYEKLDKVGLAYLVAKLGNAENRADFFAGLPVTPTAPSEPEPQATKIQAVLDRLKRLLHAQNEAAHLRASIDELTVEQRYLQQWQLDNVETEPALPEKYKLSPRKSADLMAYLTYLAEHRIGLKERVDLLLNFRIFRTKPFANVEQRTAAIHALQLNFYEKVLREKRSALAAREEELKAGNFDALLDDLRRDSMAYLKHYLHRHLPTEEPFDSSSYRTKFDAFLKRYPIIGSSTHSIVNSIAVGAILDYVIIDEASQQDIVPGILALGCARNLIVVGDRKQLPHIPAKLGIPPPNEYYDCDKYSLLDSCVGIFNEAMPTTLLKEHYRCHPKIIQFCNQQFYDNQLIPMTRDAGEPALKLIVTAKGNHTRGNTNLREVDSLLETLNASGETQWDAQNSRGFIAPYNAQVALSRTHLPDDFVNNTVHKFQGRECDEIVFSTVLDKKPGNQARLDFVDDAHLVNVAVSRAKNTFTLVTGDDVFARNNGHVAALVRYIEYYADEQQVLRAPVVSAFDLLYKEYDQSLERLNARLRANDSKFKSEQIAAQLLRDALSMNAHQSLMYHAQVPLIQLVSSGNVDLSPREIAFMKNRASCDFVVYFKVGKMPVGVIEVDGGSHGTAVQAERDALKNSILEKCGIALLRLRTVESHIEQKIEAFLSRWANGSAAV